MLFKIVTGHGNVGMVARHDIVIFVASLRDLAAQGMRFLLTDHHASLALAQFTSNLEGLKRVDWPILQASDFRHGDDDPGRHERYQAEALVHRHLPVAACDRLVCYGRQKQAQLVGEMARRGLNLDVDVHPDWFF